MALAQGHNWLGREPVQHTHTHTHTKVGDSGLLQLEGEPEPTAGIGATGEKCVKVLTKIVWFFIRHRCFLLFFFTPLQLLEIPTANLYISLFLSLFCLFCHILYLSPWPYSLSLFISKSTFEAPLSAIFHRCQLNFNGVESLLSFSFSFSLSRLLFPGVAADIQQASSNRIPMLSNGAVTT